MIISYCHNFIFFHIAKVAGTSVKEVLEEYCQYPEKFKIKRPPKYKGGKKNPFFEMWVSTIFHAKAKDLILDIPIDIWKNSFKFCFVRNPWDWQVSWFHFLLTLKHDVRYKNLTDNFEQYLIWLSKTKNPYPRGAVKFQKDVITDDNNNFLVNFVGRYENLENDFSYICKTINVNKSLPHLNKTKHKDYRYYYNDKTMVLLYEIFKDDIELFGYTFDGYNPEPIIKL